MVKGYVRVTSDKNKGRIFENVIQWSLSYYLHHFLTSKLNLTKNIQYW